MQNVSGRQIWYHQGCHQHRPCEDCPVGTFGNDRGTCSECEPGSYQDKPGQTSCTQCPANTHTMPVYKGKTGMRTMSVEDRTSIQGCLTCEEPYSVIDENGMCKLCPYPKVTVVREVNGINVTFCEPCGEGTFNIGNGTCGTYCDDGYILVGVRCEACYAGTYHNGSTCVDCPVGYAQSSIAQTECLRCTVNEYGFKERMTTCFDSDPGYYAINNNTNTAPCEAGTYTDGNEETDGCTPCEAGTFAATSGSSACTDCADGTISSAGSTECTTCEPGRTSTDGVTCIPDSCFCGFGTPWSARPLTMEPCHVEHVMLAITW